MKTPLKTITLLASAAFFTLTSAPAVETDPVGYVTIDVAQGLNVLAVPLQKSPIFTGQVSNPTDNTVTIQLDDLPSGSYHIHVVKSDNALGKVSAVTNFESGTVTFEPTIPEISSNDTVSIRPNVTLKDISATPEFNSGTTLAVYPGNGTIEAYEYFPSSELGTESGLWADSNSEDASDVAILPSEGFVLNNASSPKKIVVAGAVAVDPVEFNLGSVFSILGSNSPAEQNVTIGDLFKDLGVGSTITIYTRDGSLAIDKTYEVFDSSDLGLGEGKTFVRDGEFVGDQDLIQPSSGLVVNPSASSFTVMIPPAYPVQQNDVAN